MNINWKETYDVFASLPKEELYLQGKQSSRIVLAFLESIDGVRNAALSLLSIVATFVKADRKIGENEYKLFIELTNIDETVITYEVFRDILDDFNSEDYELVDQLIDSLHPDIKTQVIVLALVFCSIDGKVTPAEQKMIEKLYR